MTKYGNKFYVGSQTTTRTPDHFGKWLPDGTNFYFLKPLVSNIKSYIKDTTDFVRHIRDLQKVPQNTLLVTLDVTSLYTNIPNQKVCERVPSSANYTDTNVTTAHGSDLE